jgi:hypothetical protein
MIVLVANARHLDRPLRIFAAASVSLVVWLTIEVGVFASSYSFRVEERNLFYVMPLFVIALLVWIERGQPRPPRATVAAALVAAALPGALPFVQLLSGVNSESDTYGLRPWWYVRNALVGEHSVALIVVVVSILLAAAFLWLPRRYAPWLPAVVAAGFLFVWLPLQLWDYSIPKASIGALFQGIRTGDRDWIDTRVGRDANVAAIWTNRGDKDANAFTIWENEFFNRSVKRVYDIGAPLPGADAMPEAEVKVDQATGQVRGPDGKAIVADYVLTDTSLQLVGKVVGRDRGRDMVLQKVDPPLRVTTRIVGIYPNDTWSGPEVRFVKTDCRGGRLIARVRTDSSLFPKGETVIARGAGRGPKPFRLTKRNPERTIVIPLRPRNGTCSAEFEVTPTAVPRDVLKGNNDPRELGVHFDRLEYRPPR